MFSQWSFFAPARMGIPYNPVRRIPMRLQNNFGTWQSFTCLAVSSFRSLRVARRFYVVGGNDSTEFQGAASMGGNPECAEFCGGRTILGSRRRPGSGRNALGIYVRLTGPVALRLPLTRPRRGAKVRINLQGVVLEFSEPVVGGTIWAWGLLPSSR